MQYNIFLRQTLKIFLRQIIIIYICLFQDDEADEVKVKHTN